MVSTSSPTVPAAVAHEFPASPRSEVITLATDRRSAVVDLHATVTVDRARRGSVASMWPGGAVRRAEPGPAGPLLYEARPAGAELVLSVRGAASTPSTEVERAMAEAIAWAGMDDDPDGFADVVAAHPFLQRLTRALGVPRLSRTPRVGEALGRAVIAQLVQQAEARRSTAQMVAGLGTPAPADLWCWPSAQRVGSTPSWTFRRCGISSRGARALHAGALVDARLREATVAGWDVLDRRLRALPGVGVWTSAETRLALGDADAVSVGDYNLPALVGFALGGGGRQRHDRRPAREVWSDADMLALLAPFTPHRGRVIRLLVLAVRRGMVAGPPRRGPRARLSAHRYW